MIRVVADDKIPFLRNVLEPYAEIRYIPGSRITRETLINADALLTRTRTKCTSDLLTGTTVQFIATATIGFDHIDTKFCEEKNIYWTNAPGCNSSSVQQYIASALLKISKRFGFDLRDKTLGIIGVGNVGAKVEKFAQIMGMNVLLCDPPRARKEGPAGFTNLEKLLRESDIVTLHVPLNITGEDRTWHLFDDRSLRLMKKGVWFFNTSRGEVAETSALKKIATQGTSGGTVIDVWENEPHIDPELLAASYIATPHIAGYSTDGKANGTAMSVNALCKFFDLPLVNWYPDDVPVPPDPVIQIDGKGKSDQDIIREAVLLTYNIGRDDKKLRSSIADFEKQRGDYPLRREFPAYTVRLGNSFEKAYEMLQNLGFNLENS